MVTRSGPITQSYVASDLTLGGLSVSRLYSCYLYLFCSLSLSLLYMIHAGVLPRVQKLGTAAGGSQLASVDSGADYLDFGRNVATLEGKWPI